MSKKFEKYMSQYGERNYALKIRKIEKSDLREYSNRSQCGQTAKASCSNSIQQSRQEQEEEVNASIQRGLEQAENGRLVSRGSFAKYVGEETLEEILENTYHKHIGDHEDVNENTRKENVDQAHQQRQQGIQAAAERRLGAEEILNQIIKEEKMKKQTMKERKHESKETKSFEKQEERKEKKEKKK